MVRKRIYGVILVLLLMMALIGCADSEDSEYGTVLHEESPHGRYWVSAYCPEGYGNLGGDAEIEFTVYDDEKKVQKHVFHLMCIPVVKSLMKLIMISNGMKIM